MGVTYHRVRKQHALLRPLHQPDQILQLVDEHLARRERLGRELQVVVGRVGVKRRLLHALLLHLGQELVQELTGLGQLVLHAEDGRRHGVYM